MKNKILVTIALMLVLGLQSAMCEDICYTKCSTDCPTGSGVLLDPVCYSGFGGATDSCGLVPTGWLTCEEIPDINLCVVLWDCDTGMPIIYNWKTGIVGVGTC